MTRGTRSYYLRKAKKAIRDRIGNHATLTRLIQLVFWIRHGDKRDSLYNEIKVLTRGTK